MPPFIQIIILCISLLSFVGCGASSPSTPSTIIPNQPDSTEKLQIYYHGQIYTVNPEQPKVEAMMIKNGVIVNLGTDEQALNWGENQTERIDLMGKMVMPGIHDVHMHPLEAGSDSVTCIIDDTLPIANQQQTIANCADDDGGTPWVLGWGHTLEQLLADGRRPKDILDALIPDRPVAIMEQTSHSVWVNSLALSLADITRNTENTPGGVIMKDVSGDPNGLLLDSAGDLVFDLAYAPNPELKQRNYQGLLYALKQIAANGITSFCNARVYWKRGYLDAWYQAKSEHKLTARTVLGLWVYPAMDDDQQITQLKSLYDNDPTSLLRVSQIKMYSDGIIVNSTAALNEPYLKYFNQVGALGLSYFSEDRMSRYIIELQQTGFDTHIHAIGDRGVHQALNAIENAQLSAGKNIRGYRHRITHLEMVDSSDRERFKALGVIADFQVAGDFALPEHYIDSVDLIGDRAFELFPVRSIFDSGATVTLSSDWDVSPLSPFVGMQHALQLGQQSLPSLQTVIKSYTLNGAYLMRQEQLTGSLEIGKQADFIVLNQNLFEIPIDQIAQTQVEMTFLAGEIVYQK